MKCSTFQTREIKEKLQLLDQANADEKMQTIRKEIETEYAARSEELGEMYVAEKKKLQDEIDCLQVELRVSEIISILLR